MSNKRSKKKKMERSENIKQTIAFELYGLVLLAISIIALVQPGAVGGALRGVFRFFTGSWDFIVPLFMVLLSFYLMWKRQWPSLRSYRWAGGLLICLSLLILSHLSFAQAITANGQFADQSILGATWEQYKKDISPDHPVEDLGGGMVGAVLYSVLNVLFDSLGTKLIVFFLIIIGILLITGKPYMDIIRGCNNKVQNVLGWMKERRIEYKKMMEEEKEEQDDQDEQEKQTRHADQNENPTGTPYQEKNLVPSSGKMMNSQKTRDELEHEKSEAGEVHHQSPVIHDFTDIAYSQGEMVFPELAGDKLNVKGTTKEMNVNEAVHTEVIGSDVIAYEEEQDYQLPPYSLLKKQGNKHLAGKKDLASNATKLEQTLQSFGVKAKVTDVHRGPAVTRYEVYPDVGVKVSRIVSLTDDIALALAAKGIRLEAPIPGKSAIGIEVPNEDVAMVTLREILESSKYHESDSKLSIALGRDISGEPIVAHLNKMPHLLVAGATGSGKSVCINGIITSILYKAKPNEVKLMMIDPKMVELNMYNGIPHLLSPVVTDARKASIALKKVVAEMERRYDIFAQSGNRDIERYNEWVKKKNQSQPENKKPLLPYIVVIVDELADLMMVAPGDVEDAICRLAQMARAAGIHLIIATQRPSVDVITGVIKANIPSRIAFGVSSQADSRTILDMGGAEKLLGRGDMLFLPVGASKPLRIQGTFLADEEVEQIVSHCIEQQKAKYHEEMIPEEIEESDQASVVEDDLYTNAVELVVHQGTASVSMLQRRFRIGYTRAARLIDSMEANGVVGPYEGSKPREVLVSKEESHIS
jgi:S-DNA-T family DNA segregation ATPase FtsK/SpoIIIE